MTTSWRPFRDSRQAALFAACAVVGVAALWWSLTLVLLAAPFLLKIPRLRLPFNIAWLPRKVRGVLTIVLLATNTFLSFAQPGAVGLFWALYVASVSGWAVAFRWFKPTEKRPVEALADWRVHLAALRACGYKPSTDPDGTPSYMPGVAAHYRVNDDGSRSTWFALPDGWSVRKCHHDDYASKFDEPAARIVLSEHRGRAGQLKVTIKAPPVVLTTHEPTLPAVASWRDPVRVGRDTRTGAPVLAPVFDQGMWLVCGRQGSGKTSGSRLLAAHFAADPTATLYLIDGKGMRSDWYGLRGRCAGYVDRNMKDAPAATLALLQRVIDEMDARMVAADRATTPGMLFLFEEQSMMRSRLATVKGAAEQMDRMMTEIVQGCRAGNICTNVITQKPSAKQLSTDTRSQAGVVWSFNLNVSDSEMAFDERPEGYDTSTLPTGNSLLKVNGRYTPVMADYVADGPWAEFMARWPVVQDTPVEVPQDTPVAPTAPPAAPAAPVVAPLPDPTDTGPAPADPTPMFWAALAVVRAHPDRELAPTALFNALPDAVRPSSVMVMSLELKAAGWPSRLVRRHGVKVRMFAAADVAGTGGTGAPVGVSVP